MKEYIQLTTTVLGGLAIFIYGMGLMSEGLKETAGGRLKAVLGYVTRNRFFAVLAGAGITALIQSSSATSVMTVGFVNAGLVNLQQAIGVIFGANIGTTITGQIVSLKLDDFALPAVTLGVAGLMIAKKAWTRGTWRTCLGFGLLFFGMSLMSHELKGLAKTEGFASFFSLFDCTPKAGGFMPPFSVLGAVAVGMLTTMLVQSSSATIGITIALAETGVISIWTAVPIVLGDNIGTTITAALASIGGNANAKRTALAHSLFNTIGTMIVLASFVIVTTNSAGVAAPVYFHLVDLCTAGSGLLGEAPGRHVAMAHTIFNIANTIALTPFIPQLARLCSRLVGNDRSDHVSALEPHLVATPGIALHAARLALGNMTRRAWVLASAALANCIGRAGVDEQSVVNAEREIDEVQASICEYLVAVSRGKLTERQAETLPELVHCVNDAERIADIALRIYRKAARLRREGLPGEIARETNEILRYLRPYAFEISAVLRRGGEKSFNQTVVEAEIRRATRALSRHYSELTFSPEGGEKAERKPRDTSFLTIIAGIRDITRHLGNISDRIGLLE